MPEIIANIQQGKYEEVLASVKSPMIALTELIKNASDSCTDSNKPIIVDINQNQRTIQIINSGIGFSKYELERLGEAGYSSKMINGNDKTPIDNNFAGSKGLGLLTAFFIAETLEIDSFSEEDGKAYHLRWTKGQQKYNFEESESEKHETVVSLIGVYPEKLQMILLPEEKVKLFMASIRFFTDITNLPKIRLIINGKEESYYPKETLDSFYSKNKGASIGFVSKATFSYKDNTINLSYEDNISNCYSFSNLTIDLTDQKSVDSFVRAIKAPERGAAFIKSICDSRVFMPDYYSFHIPAFSGVLYTWRNRKNIDIEQWPSGVRVFINNYSLYRYLDKENDWLNLSEISQNIRATNYKLKNTYGYIDLNAYNENQEELKISKERDDFIDSMAQRKFLHIMRDVIIGVFTRLDMIVKNAPMVSLDIRNSIISVKPGTRFNLSSIVSCNNVGLDDIVLDYNHDVIEISDDWVLSANQPGEFFIKLLYGDIEKTVTVKCKRTIPEFDLLKSSITVLNGNTFNLRNYISIGSCVDVNPDEIEIMPEDTNSTFIESGLFSKENAVGSHIVYYRYGDFQKTLTVNVKEIDRQPGFGLKTQSIISLFDNVYVLRKKLPKIPELVEAISSYYHEIPTLCMAAIRILIECSAKAFMYCLVGIEAGEDIKGTYNRVINICYCNPKNPDYQKCLKGRKRAFCNEFNRISAKYKSIFSEDVKKNLNTMYDTIDFNMFVHNPNVTTADTTVEQTMHVFAPLLNYIFDVLVLTDKVK